MAPGVVASGHGGAGFAHLIDPSRKWYNDRRMITLNAWIVLFLITSSTNGFDGSMMNGLQALPQWNSAFNNPAGSQLGLLNAIQNIGSLAGYPFAPYLSDGLGRRRTIFVGAFIMCIAVALQTAAQSVGMFIGARFLIGFGLTFAANSAPMLVTELAYPPYRAPLTSLYNSLWYAGSIVAAWSTFGTFKIATSWSWRIPSLLQGIPSILQIFLVLFAPESPRWLVSKGRDQEALKTLAYYHAGGNEEDPLVQFEYEEIKAMIDFDRTVAANVGWKSLFMTPGNRRRMRIIIAIAFFSQWSANGLASYYLGKILDSIGIKDATIQLLINGILQIWNLFWAVLAAFLADRAGRRLLFLSSAVGMLVFFTSQTVCFAEFSLHGTKSAAHANIAFIFLFFAAYDIAFTPLIVSYTVEILPFALRAKGFNVFNFVVSAAIVFNQYVNPIALKALGWKYYCVYCAWLAFELVYLYLFVVETKGRTLEETAALFDGEQAIDHIVAQNTEASEKVEEHSHDEKI
ncbi:general substrate transporter [Punctularia strigosozonata HHB-11173 SS5]|uniref:general substrate transporter n=1 Tax=Punctularia strigosozonata (strain HHB-11173) TaxID=741275 RepID=UPI00044166D2|nr:general substrate transporter [Punctularia strigosozonata HHB-11173 SS5]EIN07439.1 general substrate transporter [Punctularia strigosozonata HHB-11173 SS5]